jgi:hypothetical protein
LLVKVIAPFRPGNEAWADAAGRAPAAISAADTKPIFESLFMLRD